MPLTKYSGANLKKLKKDELRCHIVELYGFIDIFSNENLLKKKDEEIEEIKGCLEAIIIEKDKALDDINKLKDGNKQLNDVYEKLKFNNEEKDGIIFNIGDELKEYIDDHPTHKEGEIYDAIKKLKEERDSFKIAMIKHTTENYDKWRKEQESDAIGLMKLDLDKAQKENKEVKKEMKTMYHIIMNDGEKYELSDKQPLIKMVQFNIGLMWEKFKEMGAIIIENAVKVIKWDRLINKTKDASHKPEDFDIWEFLGEELEVSSDDDDEE